MYDVVTVSCHRSPPIDQMGSQRQRDGTLQEMHAVPECRPTSSRVLYLNRLMTCVHTWQRWSPYASDVTQQQQAMPAVTLPLDIQRSEFKTMVAPSDAVLRTGPKISYL